MKPILKFVALLGLAILYAAFRTQWHIYSWLILAVGIGLCLPYVYLLFKDDKAEEQEINSYYNKLRDIKRDGIAIQVDLNQATVKSNSWIDIETDNSKYGGYNQLFGYGESNIKQVKHDLNLVQIEVDYQGKTIKSGINVSMDTKTLKMKLALQQNTILYYNPNTNETYLDLEFLRPE